MSRFVRVLALAAALSLLAGVAVADDTADLRSELGENRTRQQQREQELAEVEEQAGDVRARLATAQERLDSALAQLAQREQELAAAQAELDEARGLATEARAALLEAQRRLEAAQAELALMQGRLDDRVRAAFKYGQVSFAEAFVGTRDIADFLNSTTYVGHVMASDRELVEGVSALLDEVERQRGEAHAARVASEREAQRAEAAAAEVEVATRDQQRLTGQVAQRRAAHASALEELEQDAAVISEHLDDLQRSEDQVRSQIAAAEREAQERLEAERQRRAREQRERELAQQPPGDDGDSGGGGGDEGDSAPDEPPPSLNDGWLRPTDGRVTSGYGYRTHPVHGGQRLHAGVDLASSSGTPVRASRDGIVSFVGWMSGYGNTVMVSHGDGLVTLYAHLSSYSVSRDAYVPQGQTVGGVGMTGTATGPHVHFEVRTGGSPQNPCGYVSC